MNYLSICSGIEAASVAWHQIGWEPVGFSEIEPFPSAVLAHHYPGVPNFGDMTKFEEWDIGSDRLDLLVGGTPCQAFSVAGLRKGLKDERGNLTLIFCEMADHFDPEWIVWENVPGVLSSKDNAFGCFLAALCGSDESIVADKGWDNAGVVSGPKRTVAWRILDAQYTGVAQRRRRVFVCAVRGSGNWACASALFPVGESLFWNSAPSREKRKATADTFAQCFEPRSPDGHARLIGEFSPTLNRMGGGQREPCVITGICASDLSDLAPTVTSKWSKLSGGPAGSISELGNSVMVGKPIAFQSVDHGADASVELSPTIRRHDPMAVAQPIPFDTTQITSPLNYSKPKAGDPCHPLAAGAHIPAIAQPMAVRRLTPIECERLQGFPDGYTNIPWRKSPESPDGPRYKALGNSMAVPVMYWIGKRIERIKRIQEAK